MITVAAVALVTIVGLLFASMAIAPLLIESGTPKTRSKATLALVKSPAVHDVRAEHPRAA